MKTHNRWVFFATLFALWLSIGFIQIAGAIVVQEDSHTYLIDQPGERWDITQAVSIGFDPKKFEFGIGRDAFRPLTESDWHPDADTNASNLRIIGVADGDNAHAYSVSRLSHHETANTTLSSRPIVAGY